MSRFTKITISVFALAAAIFLSGFLFFATIATRQVPENAISADGIVVLTGGVQRIARAGELLEAGHGRRLLISGINKITTPNDIRKLLKVRQRLFDCCVDLGYTAQNTRGNAHETRGWMRAHGFRSVIVVTASYHMPRSIAELHHAMPDVQLVAHPVLPPKFQAVPWWLDASNASLLAVEYVKFLPSALRSGVAWFSRSTASPARRENLPSDV